MASLRGVTKWDFEADIVIVGFGLAACSAAIEALAMSPGIDILILEKMPRGQEGGNSRAAGQSLLIPKNAEALAAYQRRMSESNPIPEEMLREWAERMMTLEPWIIERAQEAGAKYRRGGGASGMDAVLEFEEYGAAEAVAFNSTILPTPAGVWLAFKACVDKRPLRVEYETRVTDLVQDPDTLEVYGAIATQRDRPVTIKAKKAVIMCSGGFENSLDMQRNYFGLSQAVALGTPGNTGDGIKILQKAGADMWHLRNKGQSGGIWPGFKVPEFPTAFIRTFYWQNFGWIEVAGDNQRFYNETVLYQRTHFKEKIHGQWVDTLHANVGPVHMIFDDDVRANNCLVLKWMTWVVVVNKYEWSIDNSAEVAKGWIKKANSIEELARLIDRDPMELATTVAAYNAACSAKVDTKLGRDPRTLQPIAKPPYYAMEVVPAIVCTGGGARRNIESEVLDHSGASIPRLYEAGELGSMFSNLYQNGSYLTEAMISGRAAGKNAAALQPWSDTVMRSAAAE